MERKLISRPVRWIVAFLLLFVAIGCVSPTAPTLAPDALETVIFQTAAAASTQTALFGPSATPFMSATPSLIPKDTPTEIPTATATVIFKFPTFTSVPATNAYTKSYACETVSMTPADGATVSPGQVFNWTWIVKNAGSENWDGNSVDVLFIKGDQVQQTKGFDLTTSVPSGGNVSLVIPMQAPDKTGNYKTSWGLQSGYKSFCQTTLHIKVK
jgi:non-ribosomal peptide synthetase component F